MGIRVCEKGVSPKNQDELKLNHNFDDYLNFEVKQSPFKVLTVQSNAKDEKNN